jgi:hypothetical protein
MSVTEPSPNLSTVIASSFISGVPAGASPIVKVPVVGNLAGFDSVPKVFKEVTLAT